MQVSSSSSYNYTNPYAKTNESSNQAKMVGLDENSEKEVSQNGEEESTQNTSQTGLEELTPEEEQLVSELQARDTEVRAHEAAHLAAAGSLAAGGASFTYQQGPDGKQYAIGGEVPIDVSEGNTPEETIARMRQVKAAATAPADPSAADMRIASTAAMIEMKAQMELAKEKADELSGDGKNPYSQDSDQNKQEQNSPIDLIA